MDQQETRLCRINEIHPNLADVHVAGLVISKQTPRQVKSTKQSDGQDRYVGGFTIRDSVTDCVNCSVWGNRDFVLGTCGSFRIGDVIVVRNAQAIVKTTHADIFNPSNKVTFDLRISERQGGSVQPDDDDAYARLRSLLRSPNRPHNDYYTLSEIVELGANLDGQCVNVLVAVKKVSSVQKVTTKAGKELEKMEVRVFDNTLDSFTFVVWEQEYFEYIQNWQAMRSVVFAVDVKVSINRFKNCVQGSFTGKTICFTDPETVEGRKLFAYAQEYELRMGALDEEEDVNAEDELKVYLVEELVALQGELCRDMKEDQSHPQNLVRGIMYPAITQFDIDDPSRGCITTRCASCKRRVENRSVQTCPNNQCSTRTTSFVAERTFDLSMSLSDHTGTIDRCRIGGVAAEKMLGVSVEDFEVLTAEDVTGLKWTWLLERCKVRFRWTPSLQFSQIRIEMCEKPPPEELLRAARP